MQTLPVEFLTYLNELAADIAAHGGPKEGQSILEAAHDAHRRRLTFAMEMAEAKTDRAQMVRHVLAAKVYADVLIRKIFESCQHIEDNSFRNGLRFIA